jgi:glycerophosphoryl diester phosphodiesterase
METDVRATADGVAVCLHDPTLQRVTGRTGLVGEVNWHELRAFPLQDGQEVPRLEDVLGTWPGSRWNIDIKSPSAIAPVARAIERTGSKSRVLVTSFSSHRTARVRALVGPDLATGAGRSTIAALLGTRHLPFAVLRPSAVAAQVPVRYNNVRIVDIAFVRACHKAGVAVHVWTVDDDAEMEQLLDLGVDGIMTDRPSVLKVVLERRGQWS